MSCIMFWVNTVEGSMVGHECSEEERFMKECPACFNDWKILTFFCKIFNIIDQ